MKIERQTGQIRLRAIDGGFVEEDGQSSVLVATDENGKPGLVKAGLGRVCVLWGLVPVCVKRALGLIFDVLCLYAVWSFPAAFHGFFSYEHLADLGKLNM